MSQRYLMRVAGALLTGLTGYAGWWLYDYGKLNGAAELGSLRKECALLEHVHENSVRDNAALREKVAVLERSGQIDRLAAQEVKDELVGLQHELQTAREEVAFYRGIMAPGEVKPGLRIHRFTLDEGLESGRFEYDLVLTQLKRNDRYVSGHVKWKIIGRQGDEIRELDLAAVNGPASGELSFRFRYFQHLTGAISLPAGFQAEEVILSVQATGKKAPAPVEQSFQWPAAES